MSRTLIHQSPQGALNIVGVPGAIEPGEPFTVDDALADSLLEQSDLYLEVVEAQVLTVKDLRAELKARGLPTNGNRDELEARLAPHLPTLTEDGQVVEAADVTATAATDTTDSQGATE